MAETTKPMEGTAADPMAEAERSLLSGVHLLCDLDRDERTAVERMCRYKRFSAQEQIIDRDSITTDVFFVVRGRVRVVNYSVAGREITFDDVLEGGYFGELAALDGQPRSASVMALEDSLIVALPRRVFLDVLAQYPKTALRAMMRLATIVRHSNDRIMDLSTLAANNRVQAEVLRQARDNMVDENAARIEPIPIHSDIASRVSTTRETVARVLNDLARRGVVERTKNALLLNDVDSLQAMVDEVRGE